MFACGQSDQNQYLRRHFSDTNLSKIIAIFHLIIKHLQVHLSIKRGYKVCLNRRTIVHLLDVVSCISRLFPIRFFCAACYNLTGSSQLQCIRSLLPLRALYVIMVFAFLTSDEVYFYRYGTILNKYCVKQGKKRAEKKTKDR